MSSDAVALASVLSTATVAVIGLLIGVRQSAKTRAHEREMAQEARRQERCAAVYVDVLKLLQDSTDFVEGGQVEPPILATMNDIFARLTAFGTPAVFRAYGAWIDEYRRRVDTDDASPELSVKLGELMAQISSELQGPPAVN